MRLPEVAALNLSPPERGQSMRTPPRPPSPALDPAAAVLTPVQQQPTVAASNNNNKLQLDMSLNSAVSALVHHLVQPLAVHYPHTTIMQLRSKLTAVLSAAFGPTWNETNPHQGSGARSLICDRPHGIPSLLRDAAADAGVDPRKWQRAVATLRKRPNTEDNGEEWEVWCDPGMVVWRWGGWGWDEPEFDPIKRPRESYLIIWQAAPSSEAGPDSPAGPTGISTPVRASKAIPIRAPSLALPQAASLAAVAALDSARTPSPALLPPADIAAGSSAGASASASVASTAPASRRPTPQPLQQQHQAEAFESDRRRGMHSRNTSFATRSGTPSHKGQHSTSSRSSDSSDTNSGHTQIMTPSSRPGSADILRGESKDAKLDDTPVPSAPLPSRSRESSPPNRSGANTPTTPGQPTVTPYDGGNVTVLGGGTKLGGSRPASVSSSRGHDRTRSPSVSISNRALSTAVGPNSNGGAAGSGTPGAPSSPRKQRTRRRIMPTHLGHFGQPGIGAPIMGAFGMQKPGQGAYAWPHGQPGGPAMGVGVGVPPPAVGMVPMGLKRMS